jgi:hypothetical protein
MQTDNNPTWLKMRRYVRYTCDMLAKALREHAPDAEALPWPNALEAIGRDVYTEPEEGRDMQDVAESPNLSDAELKDLCAFVAYHKRPETWPDAMLAELRRCATLTPAYRASAYRDMRQLRQDVLLAAIEQQAVELLAATTLIENALRGRLPKGSMERKLADALSDAVVTIMMTATHAALDMVPVLDARMPDCDPDKLTDELQDVVPF